MACHHYIRILHVVTRKRLICFYGSIQDLTHKLMYM